MYLFRLWWEVKSLDNVTEEKKEENENANVIFDSSRLMTSVFVKSMASALYVALQTGNRQYILQDII